MLEINRVYNEDCLGDKGLCLIADNSVDMILCDMPYGTTACKWDTPLDLDELWKQYKRIIKDNAAIVMTASQPFTTALISSNMRMFKYCWVWVKNCATNFPNAKRRPLTAHEDIIVWMNSTLRYNPQKTYGHKPTNSAVGASQGTIYHGDKIRNYMGGDTDRFPLTVLEFACERGLHPTQKPVDLFEYLIMTYTNSGDTVLDNCAGSGTTPVACIRTDRNFIGFEWCPEEPHDLYYNIACQRIKDEQAQTRIVFPDTPKPEQTNLFEATK